MLIAFWSNNTLPNSMQKMTILGYIKLYLIKTKNINLQSELKHPLISWSPASVVSLKEHGFSAVIARSGIIRNASISITRKRMNIINVRNAHLGKITSRITFLISSIEGKPITNFWTQTKLIGKILTVSVIMLMIRIWRFKSQFASLNKFLW